MRISDCSSDVFSAVLGMPSYQVLMELPSNLTTYWMHGFKGIFPHPIDVVLLYLIGAYLLFSVLRVKPWLAAVGAIAFAFSSYNFIYIEAGHARSDERRVGI